MAKPIQITVGGDGPYDPAPGATECPIASLAGKEIYVEEMGIGVLPYAMWSSLVGGGFKLLQGTFIEGDVYTLFETGFFINTSLGLGNYTNGYDHLKVLTSLRGRIGWRQPTVTAPVLSIDNKTSRSGRYFNDFHALANIINVQSIQEDPDITEDDFNLLLQSMYSSVIFRCIGAIFGTRQIVNEGLVYKRRSASADELITNAGQFVGYAITLAPTSTRSVQIHNLILKFNQAVTFTVYLFADGTPDAIWSTEVTAQANTPVVIALDGLVLNYFSTKATRFYFGYFQSDIGAAQAITEQACFERTYCYSAYPVMMNVAGSSIDYSQVSTNSTPYGINLEITSFRDSTNQIIRNAQLFDELIGLQMAANIVEMLVHSTRSNSDERRLKDGIDKLMVYMDLKGTIPISDAPSANGLSKQIERELVRLRETFFKETAKSVSLC